MNNDLQTLISTLDDAGAMRLAVAVQQQLDDPASDAAFARLSAEQASAFLASLDTLRARQAGASDVPALGAVAREFLDLVMRTEVFDDVIGAAALDTGVRAGLGDIVRWFNNSLNLASLIGIRFEYVHERKVVQRTKTGSVETARTIRVGVGAKRD
jgi:hypothetical protein